MAVKLVAINWLQVTDPGSREEPALVCGTGTGVCDTRCHARKQSNTSRGQGKQQTREKSGQSKGLCRWQTRDQVGPGRGQRQVAIKRLGRSIHICNSQIVSQAIIKTLCTIVAGNKIQHQLLQRLKYKYPFSKKTCPALLQGTQKVLEWIYPVPLEVPLKVLALILQLPQEVLEGIMGVP